MLISKWHLLISARVKIWKSIENRKTSVYVHRSSRLQRNFMMFSFFRFVFGNLFNLYQLEWEDDIVFLIHEKCIRKLCSYESSVKSSYRYDASTFRNYLKTDMSLTEQLVEWFCSYIRDIDMSFIRLVRIWISVEMETISIWTCFFNSTLIRHALISELCRLHCNFNLYVRLSLISQWIFTHS